jgi:endonuclease/exonuclease/phosphatase family metal-dependent hydrolase
MPASEKPSVPFLDDAARIECGDVTTQRPSPADQSKLIIASYNIRYGVGRYLISSGLSRRLGFNPPRLRTEKVAENIATAALAFTAGTLLPPVDILALQEADKQTGRAGGHHVARELASKLAMNWVHVPAGIPRGQPPKTRQWWLDFEEPIALHDPGDTGVALLSRFPLEDVTRIDLPWHECAWRPRLAVGATVSLGSQKLQIFNAHIDPHAAADGLQEQVEVMLDHADASTGPTVVLGDFNTLSRQKRVDTRRLLEARGYTTPFPTGTPTWRTALLRLHADWIFVRQAQINRWGVARPLNVSDHWPIWAEVSLPIADCQLPIPSSDAD